MPLVTVAIPFSGEHLDHLELAIRSVFAQSISDWKLLLVGDNPRPDLLKRVEEIHDQRVSIVHGGHRLGLSSRLNQSVELTESQFYARMDGDDVMFPTRLERQIEVLRELNGADVVGTRAVVIDQHSDPEGLLAEAVTVPNTVNGFLRGNAFTHPSVLGRTDWFHKHPYDVTIGRAEDKELWIRTQGESRFFKLSSPGLFYRVSTEFNREKSVRTSLDDFRVTTKGRQYGAGPMAVSRMAMTAAIKASAYRVVPAALWPTLRSHRIENADLETIGRWRSLIEGVVATQVSGWDN